MHSYQQSASFSCSVSLPFTRLTSNAEVSAPALCSYRVVHIFGQSVPSILAKTMTNALVLVTESLTHSLKNMLSDATSSVCSRDLSVQL